VPLLLPVSPATSSCLAALLVAALAIGCADPKRAEPSKGPVILPKECGPLVAHAVPILPRASNDEVRQLVSDLLGAPVDPGLFARWTPLAQVRGFDTMTESRIDAQTLEEQLDTAEAVAALLVQSDEVMSVCPAPTDATPVCAVHATYDATAQFSGEQGLDCWSYLDGDETPLTFDAPNQRWIASDPGLFIWSTGVHPGIGVDVIRRFVAPQEGALTLRGNVADADAGGGDGIVVAIRGPLGDVFSAVIVNGGAAESFDVSLNVQRGDAIDLVVARGATNSWDSTALSATVEFAPSPSVGARSWANCGQPVVERIASRAFRRPLRVEELADLKEVFDETFASATNSNIPAPFYEGLKATLQAALLSPNVLYKPEFVPGGFEPSEDGFRRASRLALYFRSSFADDELWSLASTGALSDDAVLRAQAVRLLSTSSERFVENFAGQWLNFRGLLGTTSADPLLPSMRREGHDVFAAVLAEGLPPESLIAPGFTIIDGPLAAHYGLDTGADPSAGPVRVQTSERGGLFTQAHFLSAASSSDFKRVIHRGLYVLNRTLCTSVPMLDQATLDEIAASVGEIDASLPLAERMEIHRSSSERCTSCHAHMDPLGLALENFDETGRWRDVYPDGSAIENGYDFNGASMANSAALATFIHDSDDYRRCVAEKLFTFGLHREPRADEMCALDALLPAEGSSETRSLHDLAIDAFLMSLQLTEEQ
jgi:Protein of unknown function (DUF1588)/Protein of unknown function (DUF1592)/Protein of unknown function (DUF1595)/Protein of unknown function (DUF1585)